MNTKELIYRCGVFITNAAYLIHQMVSNLNLRHRLSLNLIRY